MGSRLAMVTVGQSGTIVASDVNLCSVVLAAGSGAAALATIGEDGSTGIVLAAPQNGTAIWRTGNRNGLDLVLAHVSVTGTGAIVTLEYEPR